MPSILNDLKFIRGRRVTAFGVLFDFTGNDKNTTTQKVAEMVKEKWVSPPYCCFEVSYRPFPIVPLCDHGGT